MVDGAMLRELSELFARRLEEIQQGIYQQAGESFNILSTKQLGVILFEKLGLPTRKRPRPATPPIARCWKAYRTTIPSCPW